MHSSTLATPTLPAVLSPTTGPADRDPAGWDRLVRRHGRRLGGVVRHVLRRAGAAARPEEIEDLVQEVWCRLLERFGTVPGRLARYDDDRAFAYLAKVARNLAIDQVRHDRAVKRGRDWRRRPSNESLDVAESIPDPQPTPEDRAVARQLRRRFRRKCQPYTQPATARRDLAIAELALIDGWPSRRIAAIVGNGVSASTVDSLVHRMRLGLAREGVELPRRGGVARAPRRRRGSG